MTEEEEPITLERFIHKLHLRTFEKIMPHVKEKFGDSVSEQDVRDILETFVRDPKHLNQKKFYNKIFSDHPHAWMMDFLDNGGKHLNYNDKLKKEAKEMTKETPIYWYIFININTRYAAAYPIYRKEKEDAFDKLQQFLSEHKCSSLTSDKESTFISEQFTKYLTKNHISQYIVLDGNHTSLAILDSFIRHLRDMNITNEKSKYQSHHSKYRNFSTHRMNELIQTYNKTIHSSTNMKPIDMENDEKKERQYIAYCLIQQSKKKNHDIPTGHFVRIVLAKDKMKKMRFKVSREVYKITGRDNKNYFISAEDDMTTSLPRHRLIDLGPTKPNKYKFAETIPFKEGYYLTTKILSKAPHDRRPLVQYGNVENGNDKYDYKRFVDIRRHHPQIESKVEKESHTIRLTVPNTKIRINLNHE